MNLVNIPASLLLDYCNGVETILELDFDEDDGFSTTEVEFFQQQIAIMDEKVKEFLISPDITPIDRYISIRFLPAYAFFTFFTYLCHTFRIRWRKHIP